MRGSQKDLPSIKAIKDAVVSTTANGANGGTGDGVATVTLANLPGADVLAIRGVDTVVGVALGDT